MEICSLIDTSCYKPYQRRGDEVVKRYVWIFCELFTSMLSLLREVTRHEQQKFHLQAYIQSFGEKLV